MARYLSQQMGKECFVIDEGRQDEEIFGDFWDDNQGSVSEIIQGFLSSWQEFINKHHDSKEIYIFDNALLNQSQYLMALGATWETLLDFFRDIVGGFAQVEVGMVFLDGNSETVIKRVIDLRKNGWGNRVAEMLAAFPYQIIRKRTGVEGMISFFADAQEMKRRLLADWPFPVVTIEVTAAEWERYQEQAWAFLAR